MVVHGVDIVDGAISLIGHLSEEAQESRNKDLKYFRNSLSRETFRSSTNEDVFNFLLVSLDPLNLRLRKLPKMAIKTYLPKA
jgi:hypothetical protein